MRIAFTGTVVILVSVIQISKRSMDRVAVDCQGQKKWRTNGDVYKTEKMEKVARVPTESKTESSMATSEELVFMAEINEEMRKQTKTGVVCYRVGLVLRLLLL